MVVSSKSSSEILIHNYAYNGLSEKARISNAICFLKQLDKKSLKILIDDEQAYEAIFLIRSLMETETETALALGCDEILGDILLALYNVSAARLVNDESLKQDPEIFSNQKNQRLKLITFILHIVVYLSDKSSDFKAKFSNHNGLKAFLEFFGDKEILTKMVPVRLTECSNTNVDFVDFFAMNLNVMSMFYEKNTDMSIKLKQIVFILLDIARTKPSTELRVYIAICNIAGDEIIETLTEIHKVASELAKMVSQCALELKNGTVKRRKMQTLDDNRLIDGEVSFIEAVDDGVRHHVSLATMLRGLYNLSVNDKLRCEIYKTNDMKGHLKVIMDNGNLIEQLFALKLLCQLSFNKHVAEDISGDEEVVRYLNEVDKSTSTATKDKSCLVNLKQTILWNLKTREATSANRFLLVNGSSSGEKREMSEFNNHVMISYNSVSRDMCLKVKCDLESSGYKTHLGNSMVSKISLGYFALNIQLEKIIYNCTTSLNL